MKFADALLVLARSDEPLAWAIGEVTDASPFTIRINGDSVDIVSPPRAGSYSPTLGDIVFVLRPGGTGIFVVADII